MPARDQRIGLTALCLATLAASPAARAAPGASASSRGHAADQAVLHQVLFARPLLARWDSGLAAPNPEPAPRLAGFPKGQAPQVPPDWVDQIEDDVGAALEARFHLMGLPDRAWSQADIVTRARTEGESIVASTLRGLGASSAEAGAHASYLAVVPLYLHDVEVDGLTVTYTAADASTSTTSSSSAARPPSARYVGVRASVRARWTFWRTTLDPRAGGLFEVPLATVAEVSAEALAERPRDGAALPELLAVVMEEAHRRIVARLVSTALAELADRSVVPAAGRTVGVDRDAYLVDLGRADGLDVDQTVVFYDVTRRSHDGTCVAPYRPLDPKTQTSACVRRIAFGRTTRVGDNLDVDGTRLDGAEAARRYTFLEGGGAPGPEDEQLARRWERYADHCKQFQAYDRDPLARRGLTDEERLMLAMTRKAGLKACDQRPKDGAAVASRVRMVATRARVEAVATRYGIAGPKLTNIINPRFGLFFGPHVREGIDAQPGAALAVGFTNLVPTGRLSGVPELFGLLDLDFQLMPGNEEFEVLFTLAGGIQKHVSLGPVSLRAGFGLGFFANGTEERSVGEDICEDDVNPCAGLVVRGLGGIDVSLDERASIDAQVRATAGLSEYLLSRGSTPAPTPTGVQIGVGLNVRL